MGILDNVLGHDDTENTDGAAAPATDTPAVEPAAEGEAPAAPEAAEPAAEAAQ